MSRDYHMTVMQALHAKRKVVGSNPTQASEFFSRSGQVELSVVFVSVVGVITCTCAHSHSLTHTHTHIHTYTHTQELSMKEYSSQLARVHIEHFLSQLLKSIPVLSQLQHNSSPTCEITLARAHRGHFGGPPWENQSPNPNTHCTSFTCRARVHTHTHTHTNTQNIISESKPESLANYGCGTCTFPSHVYCTPLNFFYSLSISGS